MIMSLSSKAGIIVVFDTYRLPNLRQILIYLHLLVHCICASRKLVLQVAFNMREYAQKLFNTETSVK